MPKTTLLRKQVTQTGSIQACAAGTIPEGYLKCDGSIVNIADYPKLYAVIGTSWGYGNNDGLTFHLPDLRGRFLRGQDEGAGRDPDSASRTTNAAGGATGDNVGSVQDHEYLSHGHGSGNHRHNLSRPIFQSISPAYEHGYSNVHGRPEGSTPIAYSGTISSNAGGNEVRPRNANVMYCIKAV